MNDQFNQKMVEFTDEQKALQKIKATTRKMERGQLDRKDVANQL